VNQEVLAAVGAAAAVARANADEAETERRLTPATVEALNSTGVCQAYVPAVYGGPELDPLTVNAAIERVAIADGAAGWCTMIAATTTSIACLLPPDGAKEVFGTQGSIAGGAFAPTGTARMVDGGLDVDGRWSWGSGTDHSDWISAGVITDSGEMRLCFIARDAARFHDTWFSSGLRGTASGDFSLEHVFVPERHSFVVGAATRHVDVPVARFPMFNVLAAGVASVCLGIGQRAVDEIVELAVGKKPAFSSKTLASQQMAQHDIGRAAAIVDAARAYLFGELAAAWDEVQRGESPSLERRARIRAACSHAAQEAARAVDIAYHLGGGSAVFATNPLQRCFRDAHTATQHLQVGRRIFESYGRLLLGLEVDGSTL
jgi:indole-3-acetate monooxygenase